ncbi:MAG: GNAT family N-acetyltransferase [Deltaproteobacteria bacterium]|nr:GNAT family N-acetyltransferase [Deltaproteobacteria bacterium]
MSRVDVRLLEPADEADYTALVGRAPGSPFSHTWPYRKALAAGGYGLPMYFGGFIAGRMEAALPAFVLRSELGGVLNSLPLAQSAGDVIVDEALPQDEGHIIAHELRQAVLQYAAANAIDVCVFIAPPFASPAHDQAQPADFSVLRATHVLDLSQPLQLHHAAREAVRKAQKATPTAHVAQTATQARAVWQLYAESMGQLNVVPRAWPFYERLFIEAPDQARFVWCELDGTPTSGLLLLNHSGVVDYHFVGNTALGRTHQTNSWLCLHELQHAQSRGARWWNWGASPTPAVADFKRRWGGTDITYALRGYCTGDVSPWRRLPPAALARHFPDYYVLPYSWLTEPEAP